MIEKTTTAFDEFQKETVSEVARLYIEGKITREEYMKMMGNLAGDEDNDQQAG